MSIFRKPGKINWWFDIYRGPGKLRLRGSTGKTDRAEAEAVEHVLRMAYEGKTSASRLHDMVLPLEVLVSDARKTGHDLFRFGELP